MTTPSADRTGQGPAAALVAVGDELLDGRRLDTNGHELAEALTDAGFRVVERLTVPDRVGAIVDALARAVTAGRVVVVTGGLGPTRDDVTYEALGRWLGQPLLHRPEVEAAIRARYAAMGRTMARSNLRQCRVPAGVEVLANRFGTAPAGLARAARGRLVFVLPGVPREMRGLFAEHVLPELARRFPRARKRPTAVLLLAGLPESEVQDRVDALARDDAAIDRSVAIAYRARAMHLELKVSAPADEALAAATDALAGALGDAVFSRDGRSLAEVTLDRLRARRATLALAESCTGGMIGEALTAVPGSSDVFLAGFVTYADRVKQRVLGVPAAALRRHGAVSAEVAAAMAAGARRRAGSDWALAVTGIAGPGGGSEVKPVGTVFVAWAGPDGAGSVEHHRLVGSREQVRHRTTTLALDGLRRRVGP